MTSLSLTRAEKREERGPVLEIIIEHLWKVFLINESCLLSRPVSSSGFYPLDFIIIGFGFGFRCYSNGGKRGGMVKKLLFSHSQLSTSNKSWTETLYYSFVGRMTESFRKRTQGSVTILSLTPSNNRRIRGGSHSLTSNFHLVTNFPKWEVIQLDFWPRLDEFPGAGLRESSKDFWAGDKLTRLLRIIRVWDF